MGRRAGDEAGEDAFHLTGMIASADGRVVLRHTRSGTDPESVGQEVARYLLDDAGGSDLGEWAGSTTEVVA